MDTALPASAARPSNRADTDAPRRRYRLRRLLADGPRGGAVTRGTARSARPLARLKIRIRKHEMGLWFRHGDVQRALLPGAYWFPGRLVRPFDDRFDAVQVLQTKFEHPLLAILVQDPTLREQLVVVELGADERALVWKDGRLGWILGPGRHAFWKQPYTITVETQDVKAFTFTHPKLEAVLDLPGSERFLEGVRVEVHERVLLFRDDET